MNSRCGCPAIVGRGFTLIELLVVIGIVVLLATCLTAVSRRVIDQGKGASCVNNLRQLGGAFAMYASENDGLLPPVQVNGSGASLTWARMVSEYLGRTTDEAFGALSEKSPYRGYMTCGLAKEENSESYSYGVNYIGAPLFTTNAVFGWPLYGGSHRLANVASRRFLAADTSASNVWRFLIMNGNVDPWNRDDDGDGIPDSSASPPGSPYGGVEPRHNHGANFLMADGSVHWISTLDWTTNQGGIW